MFRHSKINVNTIKLCRAENICWNLGEGRLEISNYLYEGSTMPDGSKEPYFTNLSGMRENYAFVWFPAGFPNNEKGRGIKVGWLEDGQPALLIKRYLAMNSMHLLHDEVLPGLATVLHHKKLRESVEMRLIVTLDDAGPNPNDVMMSWLGQFWNMNNLQAVIRFKNGLNPETHLDYICFKEAYIGMDSSATSWYHYGFEQAQGPIKGTDKMTVGKNVREMIEWIKDELFHDSNVKKLTETDVLDHLKTLKSENVTESRVKILIASRTMTRKILNEEELKAKLEIAFPSAQVQFIRQETMEVEELIMEISGAVVLIGMHGALLALSAFLPPGALLIEMFPFGIPAENYTPYKTLALLPSMNIKYVTWINPREDEPFNRGYINRPYTLGGLKHLPASYQNGIRTTKTVPKHRCCYSPFWLYRIFQDTLVDAEDIIKIIKDSF